MTTVHEDPGHDHDHDLRKSDVEAAQRLLDAAIRDGLAPLPALMVADLCLLNAHRQAMFDEAALDVWALLTDEARGSFGGEALDGLVQRGLLSPAASRGYGQTAQTRTRYRMNPALAMILGARAKPTWLAVCSIADTAHTGYRMYGLGDAGEPCLAAVVEQPREQPRTEPAMPQPSDLGKVYAYVLASTPKASDLLAGWATRRSEDARGRAQRRRIDVYHHFAGRPLSRLRVSLDVDAYQARASIGERGAERDLGQYDRGALAVLVENAIRRLP